MKLLRVIIPLILFCVIGIQQSFGIESNSELGLLYQNDFQSYQVKHGYAIDYTISGNNEVIELKRDYVFDFVKITLRAPGDGNLSISFPHGLIGKGYSENCYQDEFSILVNGVEISDYDELFTKEHRRLSIPFSANDSEIKLILSDPSKNLPTYQECTREISLEHLQNQGYDIYTFNDGPLDFFIPYKMTNGIVKEVDFDLSYRTFQNSDGPKTIIQSNSGKIILDTNSSGFLRIVIPRHLADLTYHDCGDYNDLRFSSDEQGNEIIGYQSVASNYYSRTLQFEYLQGITEIFTMAPGSNTTFSCPYHDSNSFYYSMISPKKQQDSGISPNEIKCNESLQLVFKATDNSPACIKSSTFQKLLVRGWAILRNP